MKQAAALARAECFMVMGVDVAVRSAGLNLQQALSVAEHLVPAGAGLPPHAVGFSTMLIGLQGTLSVRLQGRELLLGDSHTAWVPPGTLYGYSNDSGEPARLMVIAFGGAQERFLEAISREPQRLPSAAARHGVALPPDLRPPRAPEPEPALLNP